MALLIRADGTHLDVKPANGSDFTLDEVYKLLACQYVEVINVEGELLIFDEEGKYGTKRPNYAATLLLMKAGGIPGDWISGDALLN